MRKNPKTAWEAAVSALSRKNHTAHELKAKLLSRGFDAQSVAAAVDRCRDLKYLDDEQTAIRYCAALRQRGYGPLRIRAELLARGLEGPGVDRLLDADRESESEAAAALAALDRHFWRFEKEADPVKRQARICRFLSYRGFSAAAIGDVIRSLF